MTTKDRIKHQTHRSSDLVKYKGQVLNIEIRT